MIEKKKSKIQKIKNEIQKIKNEIQEIEDEIKNENENKNFVFSYGRCFITKDKINKALEETQEFQIPKKVIIPTLSGSISSMVVGIALVALANPFTGIALIGLGLVIGIGLMATDCIMRFFKRKPFKAMKTKLNHIEKKIIKELEKQNTQEIKKAPQQKTQNTQETQKETNLSQNSMLGSHRDTQYCTLPNISVVGK